MEALYVTGGGSELPLVARMLREQFGRRVRRSTYTRSATAIGLAIQADASSGYALRDVFSRNFRRMAGGRSRAPDDVRRDLPVRHAVAGTGRAPLTVRRIYQPVHNIGHLRYLEASSVDGNGQPAGDIAVWDEVLFPWDPALAAHEHLERAPVEPSEAAAGQQIEEHYACNAAWRTRGDDPQPDVALHAPVHPRAVVGEGHRGHRSGQEARAPVTRGPRGEPCHFTPSTFSFPAAPPDTSRLLPLDECLVLRVRVVASDVEAFAAAQDPRTRSRTCRRRSA